MPASIFH